MEKVIGPDFASQVGTARAKLSWLTFGRAIKQAFLPPSLPSPSFLSSFLMKYFKLFTLSLLFSIHPLP